MITREKDMQEYKELIGVIEQYREKNCCGVVAVATALDKSFGAVHRQFRKAGRKYRCGVTTDMIRAVLNSFGQHETEPVPIERQTIKRFSSEHKTGTYLIFVRGHVATLKNGIVQDWTSDTPQRRIVKYFIKITK